MLKAVVYSTSWCPHCKHAKDYLTQKGVAVEEKNIELNLMARDEMIQKSGQLGVPVIDLNGKIIIGFSPDQIDSTLETNL